MRKVGLLAVVLIALFAAMSSAIAANGGRKFTTTLTGAAEVNEEGVPNQGDPDGIGTATITLNHGQGQVCWEISVSGITLPATAAHIHVAPATAPGPVVVPLSAPDGSGFSSGCTRADRELIKAIIQDPDAYYVNVHNTDYPAGALRGQLSK
jgi:hypothetical protein